MRFSAESLALPIGLTAVAVAVVGTGAAAERVVPPPYGVSVWLPDLLVGLVLASSGLLATARRRTSWTGPLLLLAGLAWFLPNYAHVWPGWLGTVAANCIFLHRALLLHGVVAYPTGRTRSLPSIVVIALCYAASVTPEPWHHNSVAIALVVAVLLTVTMDYRVAAGPRRRERLPAVGAATLFAVVIVVEILFRGAATPGAHALLTGYQFALAAVSAVMAAGLLLPATRNDEVTDLVVDLGTGRSAPLRDRLAIVLRDPTLEVGYWIPEEQRYVDAAGRPVAVPDGSSRAVTRIDREELPVAVLVHEADVLDDEGLVDAAAAATRLSAVNARLQAEMRARVAEASESRRRIVDAAIDERRRLERRLTDGVLGRLDRVGQSLAAARQSATAVDAATVDRAAEQLAAARDDLVHLARGIHPERLSAQGLTATLQALAATVPVKVTVDAEVGELSDAVAACAWFVCSEALANVVKYAAATCVLVSVTRSADLVVVRVSDDGIGGADATLGSGLRGLADRVAALGGTFSIDSRDGAGTVIVALLPAAGGA